MTKDYTLPDGFEIRVYDFGGIDVKNDAGEWITVASTPEACAELARIAMLAADGDKGPESIPDHVLAAGSGGML